MKLHYLFDKLPDSVDFIAFKIKDYSKVDKYIEYFSNLGYTIYNKSLYKKNILKDDDTCMTIRRNNDSMYYTDNIYIENGIDETYSNHCIMPISVVEEKFIPAQYTKINI